MEASLAPGFLVPPSPPPSAATIAKIRDVLREIAERDDCPRSIAGPLIDLAREANAALPRPQPTEKPAPAYPCRAPHYLSSTVFTQPRCSACAHARKTFAETPCADCARTCAAFGTKPGFQPATAEGGAP